MHQCGCREIGNCRVSLELYKYCTYRIDLNVSKSFLGDIIHTYLGRLQNNSRMMAKRQFIDLLCAVVVFISTLILLSTYITDKAIKQFHFHIRNDYCYVETSGQCVRNADNISQLVTFKNNKKAIMDYLGMAKNYDCELKKTNKEVPVIVTGASSNHFEESLESLDNIQNILMKKMYPDREIILIYYDLGLNISEYEAIKRKCNCDIRAFPFDIFPTHFRNLSNFAWKPAIIRRMLHEEDFVMWVDTSIRFVEDKNIESAFRKARVNGIQCMLGDGTIAERTMPETISYFKQDPKILMRYVEIQGGFGIYSRSRFTLETVVNPWVHCALHEHCIWPHKASNLPHSCDKLDSNQEIPFCHRADQSALGIILTHTFKKNRDKCATFELQETARMHRVND